MEIRVESCIGKGEGNTPRRFHLDGRAIEVVETLDQWHGADHRYVKVKGNDGNLYILRHDSHRAAWELTMFQSSRGTAVSAAAAAETQKRHPN